MKKESEFLSTIIKSWIERGRGSLLEITKSWIENSECECAFEKIIKEETLGESIKELKKVVKKGIKELKFPEKKFEEKLFVMNDPFGFGLPMDVKVWIYFLTSHILKEPYKHLEGALASLGIHTKDVSAIVLTREEYEQIIENLKEVFEFEELPCVIISHASLSPDKKPISTEGTYIFKKDIFTEELIKSPDKVYDFIKDLYDAAKKDIVQEYIKSKKVQTILGLTWREIQKFIKIPE
jgi:hypothetical protein